VIRPALKIVGVPAVAARMGVSERAVRLWAGGYRYPSRPLPELAQAVARAGHHQGLCAAGADDDFARCRNIPLTLIAAARFNAMAAAIFAIKYGGRVGLAARLGVSRQTVDRAIDLGRWEGDAESEAFVAEKPKTTEPVADFLDRLAKLAREMLGAGPVKRMERSGDLDGGLCEARQIVAASLASICGANSPLLLYSREALTLPVALMGRMNLPAGKEPTPAQWIAVMSYIKPWFDEISRNAINRVLALAAE
jgi:hypothetical protein